MKKYSCIILLLFLSLQVFSQSLYTVAVTPTRILHGKYVFGDQSQNAVPLPVSLSEAKSILYIEPIWVDRKNMLIPLEIKSYEMLIRGKDGEQKFNGTRKFLTPEMNEALQSVVVGDEIFFQGILTETIEDAIMNSILLHLVVRE